jgi:hypothetical protein
MSQETIALVSAWFAPELQCFLRDCDVLQFADNQAVNASAIKGYSSAPDVGRMISAYFLRLASLNARSWVHYVPSALNPADSPSRPPKLGFPEGAELSAFGLPLCRIDFVFPSVWSWSSF